MAEGGHAGAVFNAAKDRALDHFIGGRIGFLDLTDLTEAALGTVLGGGEIGGAEITLESVARANQVTQHAVDAMIRARAE